MSENQVWQKLGLLAVSVSGKDGAAAAIALDSSSAAYCLTKACTRHSTAPAQLLNLEWFASICKIWARSAWVPWLPSLSCVRLAWWHGQSMAVSTAKLDGLQKYCKSSLHEPWELLPA